MLVRTKAQFQDTERAFGWSNNFDVCNTAEVSECDWKQGIRGGQNAERFDTEEVYGNVCARWFTDYSSTIDCFDVSSSERCFNKGAPCGHAVRDHVVMYKWSPQVISSPAEKTPEPTPAGMLLFTYCGVCVHVGFHVGCRY